MNIGRAAQRSGLPAKTIRYYEEIGLVVPDRRANGYRDYDGALVQRLRFLRRARGLGFSIADCRALLKLYDDRDRASGDVKALAGERIAEIEAKIEELRGLAGALRALSDACHGDERPDCPILAGLAGAEPVFEERPVKGLRCGFGPGSPRNRRSG